MGLGRIATVILLASSICMHAVIVIVQKLSSRPGGGYPFPVIAVTLLAELCKWIGSLIIFRIQVYNGQATASHIPWRESIKWGVPALCYCFTNNISFHVLSLLHSPVLVQLIGALEIITVALFSVVILGRRLNIIQWTAITLLCSAVLSSHLALCTDCDSLLDFQFAGVALAMLASSISAFAGVWIEKQLKKDAETTSIFEQQISLYGYGVLVNFLVLLSQGGMSQLYPNDDSSSGTTAIQNFGADLADTSTSSAELATTLRATSTLSPTQSIHAPPPSMDGWNMYATLLVVVFSVMGLLTAGVVKHQSNIVKMFANNSALVLMVIFNSIIFRKVITLRFALAVVNLLIAVILYHVSSEVSLVKTHEIELPSRRNSRVGSPLVGSGVPSPHHGGIPIKLACNLKKWHPC